MDHVQVLLIEDNFIYAQLLQRILLYEPDITITTVGELRAGLEVLTNQEFNLVLLDLDLPDSSGLQTVHQIIDMIPEVPVVVLTGMDDDDTAMKAVQLGAQDFLVKGDITKGLLIRSIRYAIERKRTLDELERAKEKLEERVLERTSELQAVAEHLQNLTKQLVTIQEDERHRISQELHDEAGQALTALQISLEIIRNETPVENIGTRQRLMEAVQLTKSLMDQVRMMARNLRPPALDAFGLHQAIRDHCNRMSRQTGLVIEYTGQEISGLSEEIQITLYRVFQEALTNVIRHAKASEVVVKLRKRETHIILTVRDNGVGIPKNPGQGGIGLLGIRERLAMVGGSLELQSNEAQGVTLVATVPV